MCENAGNYGDPIVSTVEEPLQAVMTKDEIGVI
jgi:hypothetical protein